MNTKKTKRTKRTVKEPEVRRAEIIEAATGMFLAQGYDRTSMNDVMNRLNIAKGTIYHYFPSKEKLLEAVVDQLVEDYVERRRAALDETEGDALVKIRVLFTADDSEAEAITEQLHTEENVRLHARMLAVLVERLAVVFADLIGQGCDEGLFETEHPTEVAELLIAGVQFLTDEGIHPWDRATVARRTAAFPPIIESLLKAEAGSFGWLNRSAGTPPPAVQGE